MKVSLTNQAEKAFFKLPYHIQTKAQKTFKLLEQDIQYPSLKVKKMTNITNVWEARIDYHYRCAFIKTKAELVIISIGMHDTGLGKK